MSTYYNMGENISYRIAGNDDVDVLYNITGRYTRDTNDDNDLEILCSNSQRFIDRYIDGDGTCPPSEFEVYPIYNTYSPVVVYNLNGEDILFMVYGLEYVDQHRVDLSNRTISWPDPLWNPIPNDEFRLKSHDDSYVDRWIARGLTRAIHPDWRGEGIDVLFGRQQIPWYRNFCGIDFNIGRYLFRYSLSPLPGMPQRSIRDMPEAADALPYMQAHRDRLIASGYDTINRENLYGGEDTLCPPDGVGTPLSRQCYPMNMMHYCFDFITSSESWAQEVRENIDMFNDDTWGVASWDCHMFETYFNLPDLSLLSYDTSDSKFYINQPGYDLIDYMNQVWTPWKDSSSKESIINGRYKNI